MNAAGWAFAVAMRAFPRAFRRIYGDDMCRHFADRWSRSAGAGRGRFLMVTLLNTCAAGVAERWRSSLVPPIAPSVHDSARKGEPVSSLLQDLRYAARLLRRQPGFSLFVVLTLAIGIGANTAVFSVVNSVLLTPLPYPQSDRLVSVLGRFDPESGFNFPQFPLSPPEVADYRAESRAMADVAAYRRISLTVGGSEAEPERVVAAAVTPNMFPLLRVAPTAGRGFSPDDAVDGAAPTAVLSYGFWQSRFGGDPGVVGRTVPLNNEPTAVVGIMPQGFGYPSATTRIWVPLTIDNSIRLRKSHGLWAIGRLADGATVESAQAEMRTLMEGWKARYPDIHTGHYLFLRTLLDNVAGPVSTGLWLLFAATGFVLLIVCANVANAVMARGESRVREMAIRGALGAHRSRLIRLSLVESALLAAVGGGVGVALAYLGVRGLIALDPASIPRAAEIAPDVRMFGFAAAVSMLSVAVFGLFPAVRGAATNLQSTLRDTGLSASGSQNRLLFRRALVGCEVALAVVLVIGATLMIRSLDRLFAVDPGFTSGGLFMTGVSLPASSYPEAGNVNGFHDALLERTRALPGVTGAALTSGVPLWSDTGVWDFRVDGRPVPGPGRMAWNAGVTIVSPGFFEALHIPLVRGRFFAQADNAHAMPVTAINETMARRFFPGEDPIGRRIAVASDNPVWMTIVGIVGDIRDQALDEEPRPIYYLVSAQTGRTTGYVPSRSLALVTRVSGEPDQAIAAVRRIVRELDPALPVFDVQTLDTIVNQSLARPRFTTTLLGLFALIGLVLGASGIYGVLAYTVSRRTQEIGIRRALGAPPAALLMNIVAQGLWPVTIGLAAGLGASLWATTFLRSQLFGVSTTDATSYTAVASGVLLIATLACAVPARRAIAIDPLRALRTE